jgi:hypothetical protein
VSSAEEESEWLPALHFVESHVSDEGVPSAMTAPTVGCLVAIAARAQGAKRSAILSGLEELTCGRYQEHYTEQQIKWYLDSVRELTFGLHLWVEVLMGPSVKDAEQCVDILAYCAEMIPELAGRVRYYLQQCEERHPTLTDEIRAVSEYF